MFDHKLCEYLIDPLVECAAAYLEIPIDTIQRSVRNYVNEKYEDKLQAFFPDDGNWYKYPNTEIDRTTDKRPYTSMGKAKYR